MDFLEKQFGRLGNRMFQYAWLYSQFREGVIPDIYLQDVKYFEKYADEIRQMWGQGLKDDDRVAIHVRRGDYVNNPFYVDLTKTYYYKQAIRMFPDEKFMVSSDDLNWCRDYFCNDKVDYSEAKTPEEALKEMASCKGIIMANSSFSWWAAFLGNKKAVYPKNWFSDGVQRVGCPKEWIAL